MTGEQIIALAMQRRQSAGLHLRVFGDKARADGACPSLYAKDADQLARWISAAKRNGYQWEVVQ